MLYSFSQRSLKRRFAVALICPMRLKPSHPTPINRATRHPNAISTLSPVESLLTTLFSWLCAPGNTPDGEVRLSETLGRQSPQVACRCDLISCFIVS